MHNDTTTKTEITILDRAIKARARRDRDSKKRRPVVDGLIEYTELCSARAISAEASSASLRLDIEAFRDVIAKLHAELEQVREAAIGVATMVSEQAE